MAGSTIFKCSLIEENSPPKFPTCSQIKVSGTATTSPSMCQPDAPPALDASASVLLACLYLVLVFLNRSSTTTVPSGMRAAWSCLWDPQRFFRLRTSSFASGPVLLSPLVDTLCASCDLNQRLQIAGGGAVFRLSPLPRNRSQSFHWCQWDLFRRQVNWLISYIACFVVKFVVPWLSLFKLITAKSSLLCRLFSYPNICTVFIWICCTYCVAFPIIKY